MLAAWFTGGKSEKDTVKSLARLPVIQTFYGKITSLKGKGRQTESRGRKGEQRMRGGVVVVYVVLPHCHTLPWTTCEEETTLDMAAWQAVNRYVTS